MQPQHSCGTLESRIKIFGCTVQELYITLYPLDHYPFESAALGRGWCRRAGKTRGAGTRGVDLNAAVGGRTGYTDTNGGKSGDNGSKIHADCYPAKNPSL